MDTTLISKAKWGFTAKVAVFAGASVLVTGSIILLWTSQSFHTALVSQTLEDVGTEALVASVRLTAAIDRVGEDVRFLAGTPPVHGMMRAQESGGRGALDGSAGAPWQQQLEGLFVELLKAKPLYLQIRFIGVANQGLELVRVERTEGTIRVRSPGELQAKAHRRYIQETLTRPPTSLYISPITLNREHNQIETPPVPVMRVSLSVYSETTGEPFGLMIINVDMRQIFLERTSSLSADQRLYLINEDGEFLVHPEPAKAFGFEFGHSHRLADEFPDAVEALASLRPESIPLVQQVKAAQQVLGMQKAYLDFPNQQRFIGVIVEDSYEHALGQVQVLRNQTIVVSLVLLGVACLGALGFARKMTRPLHEMAQATKEFGQGMTGIRLPVEQRDEMGRLAESFNTMAEQVEARARVGALEADIATVISRAEALAAMLQDGADTIGRHLNAAYVGIWLVNEVDRRLEFHARSGWDPQLEGVQAGQVLGQEEAERIAAERIEYWTNTVMGDPRILDQPWAKQDNLVGFAGYPLLLGERVLGVVALFTRSPFALITLHGLKHVVGRLTLGITRFRQDELFKKIVESSPNGLLMVNPDGQITLVNRPIETLFGYARTELLGQPIERLVPERFRAVHPGERTAFMSSPHPRAMGAGRDLYGLRKNGTEFPIEIGLNPVTTDLGLFVLASVVDITERKQAEERFRVGVEASPSAMLMVDKRGIMTLVNKQTEQLFMYTRDELLGHPVEMLIPERFRTSHPELREGYFQMPIARAMNAGRDLYGLRKDGSEFPTEIGLNPVEMDQGTFVLVSIVDITERVQTAQRLMNSLQEKEVLLKEVHHRVKNNLTVIGSLFYLQSTTTRNQQVRRILQDCQDRVRSMALVHERLYSSDDLASVDFAEYAEELAIHLFRNYSLKPDAVQLKLELDKVSLEIDRAIPCGLILTELISNALKHAFPNGRTGEIHIVLQRIESNRLVLIVADNGVGLPDESTLTTGHSLGMRLIHSLANQLDAKFQFSSHDPGTEARLELEVSHAQ